MEKQNTQKVLQLMMKRYNMEIPRYLMLVVFVAAAVPVLLGQKSAAPVFLFIDISCLCQLVYGARYRGELSRIERGFRWSYYLSVVMAAGFVLTGVGVIAMMLDSEEVYFDSIILGCELLWFVAIPILWMIRELSYYGWMNRLSDRILNEPGFGWSNLRRLLFRCFLILWATVILVWGITFAVVRDSVVSRSVNVAGFEALSGASHMLVVIVYSLIVGAAVTVCALIGINLFLRYRERRVADAMIGMLDRVVKRSASEETPVAPQ